MLTITNWIKPQMQDDVRIFTGIPQQELIGYHPSLTLKLMWSNVSQEILWIVMAWIERD